MHLDRFLLGLALIAGGASMILVSIGKRSESWASPWWPYNRFRLRLAAILFIVGGIASTVGTFLP